MYFAASDMIIMRPPAKFQDVFHSVDLDNRPIRPFFYARELA